MLTHIMPAASFAVATIAPSALTKASDALTWAAANGTSLVTVLATVAVVCLTAWAFRREVGKRRPMVEPLPLEPVQPVVSVVPARGEN